MYDYIYWNPLDKKGHTLYLIFVTDTPSKQETTSFGFSTAVFQSLVLLEL